MTFSLPENDVPALCECCAYVQDIVLCFPQIKKIIIKTNKKWQNVCSIPKKVIILQPNQ